MALVFGAAGCGGEEAPAATPAPTPTPTPMSTPTGTPMSEPTIPPHFATYTDEASFFSISYPTDWKPFPSWHEELGVTSKEFFKFYDAEDASLVGFFILVFYAESPREPGGTSSVNIFVQPLSEGEWMLDEIVETRLRRTEEIYQEYREFSRLNTIIDGREAIVVDWEVSIPDLGKSRCLQMFTLKDKLVWKVTCYAGSEVFSDFEDDLYAMVRSLRILK